MSSRAHEVLARPQSRADDRRVARLLSALAEAPDHRSAVSFLLSEISVLAGDVPAALLRYSGPEDALVFVDQTGLTVEEVRELPGTLEEHSHPLFVSATSLMPAIFDARRTGAAAGVGGAVGGAGGGGPRDAGFGPMSSWTALPLPQPHYRGAPAGMGEEKARSMLASAGARAVAPISTRPPWRKPSGSVSGNACRRTG